MNIEKKIVAQNFSRGVQTYNLNAYIQTKMANELYSMLDTNMNHIKNILELGCGTGIFSDMLVKKYPDSNFLFADISDKMIEYLKKKYSNQKNIKYLCCDAELYKFQENYDLIASNAVFQWFENIENALKNYKKNLSINGKVIFSIYGENTYFELRKVVQEVLGENYYIQNFISRDYLEKIIKENFKNYIIKEELIMQYFDNIMDYFKYIKNIGANSALNNKKNFSHSKYKKIEEMYNKYHSENGKLNFTNHIIYVYAEK